MTVTVNSWFRIPVNDSRARTANGAENVRDGCVGRGPATKQMLIHRERAPNSRSMSSGSTRTSMQKQRLLFQLAKINGGSKKEITKNWIGKLPVAWSAIMNKAKTKK